MSLDIIIILSVARYPLNESCEIHSESPQGKIDFFITQFKGTQKEIACARWDRKGIVNKN